LLLLDAMAQRYGMTPSNMLASGDSFDLMVFDVSTNYQMIQEAKASGKPLSQDMLTRSAGKDKIAELTEKYYGNKNR